MRRVISKSSWKRSGCPILVASGGINEDVILLLPKSGLYVVADEWRRSGGEHASKLAVRHASRIRREEREPTRNLAQAFQEANNEVMNAAASDAAWKVGTTLVAP